MQFDAGAPAPGRPAPTVDASLDAAEAELARDGRWEELVEALIERAASAEEPWERVRCFVRAASIYEGELGDLDKSAIMLQAAFNEDYTSDEVARELERVVASLGRGRDLIAEYEAALPAVPDIRQRTALSVQLARFYERFADDDSSAEAHLVAAL